MDELINPPSNDLKVKVVDGEHLASLMSSVRIKEFHDFYVHEGLATTHKDVAASHVFVRSFEDLLEVL
ncbi:hypothetical protein VR46_23640 [Streptomyces sp. NRRL S-444]|nr:hypothetical protein VR46_23640 [Streptomyces sp. NRRL S-444]